MKDIEKSNSSVSLLNLAIWFDVLAAIMPPAGILVVGAGNGIGPLAQWLQSRQYNTLLVEGDETQYQHLQRAVAPWQGLAHRRDVVSGTSDAVIFHRYSNPAESGLLTLKTLRSLWPQLAAVNDIAVEDPVTVDELLTTAAFHADWIILDCLPAEALLPGARRALQQADVVICRVANGLPEFEDTQKSVWLLQSVGLRCVQQLPSRHPRIQHAVWVRDVVTESKAKEEALAQVQALQQEKAELVKAMEAQSQANLAEAKAKEEALAQVQALQQEKAELVKAKEAETQVLSKIESLHKVCVQLDRQTKDGEKRIRNELSQRSSNIIKQIEAFLGVQNYFNSNELIGFNVERNSWPISFDFAFYLVQLLELNNYDIVIEFGSGVSTVVVAKSLAKMASHRKNRSPVEFISFDHLDKYYSLTLAQLKQAQVSDLVQLHHKPLQDYIGPSGKIQPFYECESVLADLAKRHDTEELRILVIVDGPPSATGPLARYPAGPIVYGLFKGARIDILLDDYIRDDEKQIAAIWQQDLQMAGVNFTVQELKLEKDACLISI